jgi:aspartyl protease family protein
MRLHSIVILALLCALPGVLASLPARAADVSLIGTFETKAAILSIDSGAPKTIRVGQTFGGVTVVTVEKDRATVEIDGKRRTLVRGQTYSSGAASGAQSVTLSAGAGGHFMTDGQINGGTVRFVVDTGATAIALPASDATRLGIDYRKGERGITQTANGQAQVYVVKLNSVRIGGIELQNVDAVVIEQGLNIALLGNTFLNRVEMRREGATMTLTRRY